MTFFLHLNLNLFRKTGNFEKDDEKNLPNLDFSKIFLNLKNLINLKLFHGYFSYWQVFGKKFKEL